MFQFDGAFKTFDGGGIVPLLLADVTQVEPEIGVFRGDRQRLLEGEGSGIPLLARGFKKTGTGRSQRKTRIGGERVAIRGSGIVLPAQCEVQARPVIMKPVQHVWCGCVVKAMCGDAQK